MNSRAKDTVQGTAWDGLAVLCERQRLRIVEALSNGERCAAELSATLGIRQNTLSHHIKVLRDYELIRVRRDPDDQRWLYYSINEAKLRRLGHTLMRLADNARSAEETVVRPKAATT
ncbi:transcriptional regulator, MarR family [Alicyclobacillus hesperidum URH17-3-68]|uniref:ArsR/SmtB family transcription factor n=1 Tax=Alicyclobacillus hesperidum TaxID=89784 RepID=UPI000281C463|nr:metalloregulator ArsR/SmtB family transcription factor [Alicyclobacillus hesperidum]EJY54712.1 transcriptional regulator, MarR family [Alicyclobacillus hesperidum URH17-3-68]